MTTPPVTSVYNFRQAGADLATSGQPSEEQLKAIAADGYEVVINLALHNDPRYSLSDETQSVRSLGMEYVHIPVQFSSPTESDLQRFFAAMDASKGKRVWVHCAANMRVSAFVGLYRHLREGWPEAQAFQLMNDVWQPSGVWSAFIRDRLHGASTDGEKVRP
jgi:protein tyrosine phosphatase (PTP) superfamily phosphohydrolase (DUF442 family)